MVHRVKIKDSKNLPLNYASELPAFKEGKEYAFKEGINVIIGENGCGKSTLLRMMKTYLSVAHTQCGIKLGEYDKVIWQMYDRLYEGKFLGGAEVYADYRLNTFSTEYFEERGGLNFENIKHTVRTLEMKGLSKGQKTQTGMSEVFSLMFSKDAKLFFDYEKEYEAYPEYLEYIKNHREEGKEWTLLMDEPDNSMDIENLMSVYGILSFHKKYSQIITVLHNPLLIYKLSQMKHVNIIEMSEGYLKKVKENIEKLIN